MWWRVERAREVRPKRDLSDAVAYLLRRWTDDDLAAQATEDAKEEEEEEEEARRKAFATKKDSQFKITSSSSRIDIMSEPGIFMFLSVAWACLPACCCGHIY